MVVTQKLLKCDNYHWVVWVLGEHFSSVVELACHSSCRMGHLNTWAGMKELAFRTIFSHYRLHKYEIIFKM